MISFINHPRRCRLICAFNLCIAVTLSCAQTGFGATFTQLRDVIIDSKGREVVHGDFSKIAYKGAGLFIATDFYPSYDWQREKCHLLTRSGKEIQPKVPQGAFFENIYFPSGVTEKDIETVDALPADSIIEIHTVRGVGLANTAGKIILEPKYRQICDWSNGHFTFYDDKKWDAFDAQGKVNQADSIDVRMFHSQIPHGKLSADRMAFAEGPDDTKRRWGYLDGAGKVCIAPRFSEASEFTEDGVARVWLPSNSSRGTRCVLINQSGKIISLVKYEDISEFRGGLAIVSIKSKDDVVRKGLMNTKQRYTVKPKWERLDYLSDNRYVAEVRPGKALSVIDATGKILFEIPSNTTAAIETEGLIACLYSSQLREQKLSRPLSFMNVFDSEGKVVSSVSQSEEIKASDGIILASSDPNIFLKERRWTIISKSGVTADGIIACDIKTAGSNRLIKTIVNKSFSSNTWKIVEHYRIAEFANFLHDFDLIGMTRARVEELLGKPDFKTCYRTESGCTSMDWLELRYENDVITGWRKGHRDYSKTISNKPWVTINVTYDFSSSDAFSLNAHDEPKLVLKQQN